MLCYAVLQKNSAHVNAATASLVAVQAHVQKYGWQPSVAASNSVEGAIFAGTTGESKRLEAVKIDLLNVPEDLKISYRAHVQTYGWQAWVDEGEVAGTEHQSKRIEALQIVVTGAAAEDYVVMYRAHVQKYGWLDWTIAGNTQTVGDPAKGNFAGTVHESKRIEAIEVAVLKVGENDLLTLKAKAIAELNNTFNPADYTIDAENFNKAMNTAKKTINGATSASDLQTKLTAQISAVQSAAETDETLIATGETEKDTQLTALKALVDETVVAGQTAKYSELTGIKSALESAEAAIKAAKVTTNEPEKDIQKVAYAEFNKVYSATKAAVRELVDNLYNTGRTITNDVDKLVLKKSDYDTAVKALETAKPAKAPVEKTDLENLVKVYQEDAKGSYQKLTTLDVVRGALVGDIKGTNFLGKTDVGLGDDIDKNDQGVEQKTRAEETTYADLVTDYVNSVVAGLTGKSYADIETALTAARSEVLKRIQNYMRTTIEKTTRTHDEIEQKIDPSVFTNAETLQVLLKSTNVEDIPALITAYGEFCKVYAN